MIGTTNRATYLGDETGGRRFWPVRCGHIDVDALARDRDQLWAQAFVWHREGLDWWLTQEEQTYFADAEQSARYSPGAWDATITAFVASRAEVTVDEILNYLGKELKDRSDSDVKAVAKALRRLEWERFRSPADSTGNRPWKYRRKRLKT
jgi:predicted P-loop ATPase